MFLYYDEFIESVRISLTKDEFLELKDSLESAVCVSDLGFNIKRGIEQFSKDQNYFID
jgi:hypothetical protein